MKKHIYTFALLPSIKEALEVAAQRDRRSMSSLLEKIIIDHLKKEGIPWEDKEPLPSFTKAKLTQQIGADK
jgi:hypothetical protein